MTAVDVDALDAARAAATAGPWDVLPGEGIWASSPDDDFGTFVTTLEDLTDANAAYIVAMHAALPGLLAEVRRGRALREAVEELAEDLAEDTASRRRIAGATPCCDAAARLRAALAATDGTP